MSRIKKILAVVLLAAIIFTTPAYSKPSRKKVSYITATSAVAVDLRSNKILYARNQNMKLPPASTAKLVTALVVLDKLRMNKIARVSSKAAYVQPTKANLTQGAYYKTQDLLRALLMVSANDAGIALAEGVAGSEEEFAKLMNKKARALGAKDSNFCTATGLPASGQYSTAHDLSVIVRKALKNRFIRNTMMQKYGYIRGSDGKTIYLTNYNEFLHKVKYPKILGKTGYTRNARRCFAGIAYYSNRQIAIVVMRSTQRSEDIKKILSIAQNKKARRKKWSRI